MTDDLITREFRASKLDADEGVIEGIAVPWGQTIDLGGGYRERFERGAVAPDTTGVKLFYRHAEPVGLISDLEDREEGLFIRARISDTSLGRDLRTLMRDGVIDRLSVGFIPRETREEEDGTFVRTAVDLKEVSAVPFPAYSGAVVTDVRHESAADTNAAPAAERQSMTDTITAADLAEVRESIEEMERSISTLAAQRDETPVADTRSAGEILKAIVAGDEATIRAYEGLYEGRAYTGGTTADAVVKDGWVGDLTRIFDASSGVLSAIFSTGTLPANGMSIEFAELDANTLSVTEQAVEGDDISLGKVSVTTRTAPVKTYAGGTQLTRQEIERSSLNILNRNLEGLAIAAGARKKAVLRAAYASLVSAREGVAANGGVLLLGAAYASSTEKQWTDLVIDAAIRYDGLALGIDALLVSPHIFKHLKNLRAIEVVEVESGEVAIGGERSFKTSAAQPAVGALNLPGLTGDLSGIPVIADPGFSTAQAQFVNARALRQYDSALVSLSDENVVNLSKTFAVYRYGAVAAEIPAAVVPVKFAAS